MNTTFYINCLRFECQFSVSETAFASDGNATLAPIVGLLKSSGPIRGSKESGSVARAIKIPAVLPWPVGIWPESKPVEGALPHKCGGCELGDQGSNGSEFPAVLVSADSLAVADLQSVIPNETRDGTFTWLEPQDSRGGRKTFASGVQAFPGASPILVAVGGRKLIDPAGRRVADWRTVDWYSDRPGLAVRLFTLSRSPHACSGSVVGFENQAMRWERLARITGHARLAGAPAVYRGTHS